jgi:hypothetical protein
MKVWQWHLQKLVILGICITGEDKKEKVYQFSVAIEFSKP